MSPYFTRTKMVQQHMNRGTIISFRGCFSLEQQRAYVWFILKQSKFITLYIDWENHISRHNPPPNSSHVLCSAHIDQHQIIAFIERVITEIPIQIIVFDPFVLLDSTSVGTVYTELRILIRIHDISLYLLVDPDRNPIFQAEVYIDPRR